MGKKTMLFLVVMSVVVFTACSSTPTRRQVCGSIKTVPEFGFVFVGGENLGNAPVSKCFSVGYHQTGHRTFDGFVRWASGEIKRFRIRMNIDSSYTYTIFHPPGEGIKDAQSYANFRIREEEIKAQKRMAAAAEEQAEIEAKRRKDEEYNRFMYNLKVLEDSYKK